jgi:hypothetical protein
MKYQGFNEDFICDAYNELASIGLSQNEIYPIIYIAGAKWQSRQSKMNRHDVLFDRQIAIIIAQQTRLFLQTIMSEVQKLAELSHASDLWRYMLLAIDIAFGETARTDSPMIGDWLKSGEVNTRKALFAFSMGAGIVVTDPNFDTLIRQMVKARYVQLPESHADLSGAILKFIEKTGDAGYSCLNPVEDRE